MNSSTLLQMKIEKAINQKKPFRNETQKALVNLIYTHNWVSDQMKKLMKPFGITPQQYNVLRILKGAGEPITTSVIRQRLLYKMADASRMVDRLCDKGLTVRKSCPSDKRLVDVKLSEKGKQIFEELAVLDQALDQLLSKLTNDEAAQLSDLLDKIRDEE